jgi:hypothetical protein
MGTVFIDESVKVWRVCLDCGAVESNFGDTSECLHSTTTEDCDNPDCEACNYDPDLWKVGHREKPLDAWAEDDEDDEDDDWV